MSSTKNCTIPDCSHLHYAWGYCRSHYRRWKLHGDPLHGRAVRPERRRNSAGYNMQRAPDGGWELVHRAVMAKHLGRPLLPGETVHHKDGVRTNNNLANLELMVSFHPPGQRPADLLPWAREVLRRYGP